MTLQKLGIIGYGAAGNKIVKDAAIEIDNAESIAVNSTELDVENVKEYVNDVILIGTNGCGKKRSVGKSMVKEKYMNYTNGINSKISDCTMIPNIAALGGGTGSGSMPISSDLIRKTNPDKIVIPMGIIPDNSEDIKALKNTIEACKELHSLNLPYILIDNATFNGPLSETFDNINASIVEDLHVLSGEFNIPSEYNNMDAEDWKNLTTTPGLLSINKISGIKENTFDSETFDSLILKSINESYNVRGEKDGIVKRIGIILSVTKTMLSKFNRDIPEIKKEIGVPLDLYIHINIIDDPANSSIITILAGRSFPDSRIEEMVEKIEESKEALTLKKESNISSLLDDVSWINDDETPKQQEVIKPEDLLGDW